MHVRNWLKASLGINVLLLLIVLWLGLRNDRIVTGVSDGREQTRDPAANSSPAQTPSVSQAQPVAKAGLKDWIELLRGAGAPEQLLATVVQADFDQHWQKRAADMQRRYQNNEVDINDLALLDIDREMELEKEMRHALGDESFRAWDMSRQFSDINLDKLNLSSDEKNALYELRKRLRQQFRDVDIAKEKKEMDQADYDAKREAAEAEYQDQLRMLLGYQRYSSIKGSGMSADVRHALRAMNVSDDQMATAENLENQWHERQADLQQTVEMGQLDQAGFEQQMQALNDWRNQEFQRTLGTNAFEYYEKQQDPRYVDMRSCATRWGLAESDVDQVYRALTAYDKTVQDYQKQINAYESSGDLARCNDVKSTLQAYSSQTAQSLQQYLGSDRFETLKRNHIFSFN